MDSAPDTGDHIHRTMRNAWSAGEGILGVSRSYVSRVVRHQNFDAPIDLLGRSPVTPAHVIAMCQRHQQFRRHLEEEARIQAERWEEEWREEEARTRQHGYLPDSETANQRVAYPKNPGDGSDGEELCRMVG